MKEQFVRDVALAWRLCNASPKVLDKRTDRLLHELNVYNLVVNFTEESYKRVVQKAVGGVKNHIKWPDTWTPGKVRNQIHKLRRTLNARQRLLPEEVDVLGSADDLLLMLNFICSYNRIGRKSIPQSVLDEYRFSPN